MSNPVADSKVAADVETYGWHCLHVLPRDGEEGAPFTYTIGLTRTFDHPEIAIFGLSREKAHAILNDCATDIRAGTRYTTDAPLADVIGGGVRVQFKRVKADHMRDYFGTAVRYYGQREFEVWIMFWPNREGAFPWNGFDSPSQAEALAVV
jgi:hypothetical protein